MSFVLQIIRIVTGLLAPLCAIVLVSLTLIQTNRTSGASPQDGDVCLHCGESNPGKKSQFHYTESAGDAHQRTGSKKASSLTMPILGSESHFICDLCARRYIHRESVQLILMVLAYPLFLFVFIPLFAQNGFFADFLIETLLVVLSAAGLISALELYRGLRAGETALAEARDRVAIQSRKNTLGKKFSYYTRITASKLQK